MSPGSLKGPTCHVVLNNRASSNRNLACNLHWPVGFWFLCLNTWVPFRDSTFPPSFFLFFYYLNNNNNNQILIVKLNCTLLITLLVAYFENKKYSRCTVFMYTDKLSSCYIVYPCKWEHVTFYVFYTT